MSQAPKYVPNPVPANSEDLPRYIFEELTKLQGALQENPIAFIEEKNVAPSRVKQGDIAYADGINWNPGQGENLYYYDGTVWRAFAGGSGAGDFGFFYDTTDQTPTLVNTAYAITFNSSGDKQGISIDGSDASKLNFTHTGKYYVSFHATLSSNSASTKTVYFFPKINGATNAQSTIISIMHENGQKKVISRNGIFSITAGQYLQAFWASDDTDVELQHNNATAFAPATPSVTLSIIQVSQ